MNSRKNNSIHTAETSSQTAVTCKRQVGIEFAIGGTSSNYIRPTLRPT